MSARCRACSLVVCVCLLAASASFLTCSLRLHSYADVENPVFFNENTDMLLGNAKKTCEDLKVKIKVRVH